MGFPRKTGPFFMDNNKSFDIIIAGGGPAGLTSAIYSAREKMSTLVLDKTGPGGQMAFSELIENYPGFPDGISGMELAGLMKRQAKQFGAELRTAEITGISQEDGYLAVDSDSGRYRASALILAVGSQPRKLGIPGEAEFIGRGVSYCALCDGAFFSDREIIVIGGGDTAVHEAIMLSKFAKKVTLLHRRDRLRAAKTLQDKFFSMGNSAFLNDSIITSINGETGVDSVSVKNVKSGEESDIGTSGVFVAAGYEPDTGFIRGAVPLDREGYILADSSFKTDSPGVFACGDAVSGNLKQIVYACGSGAVAAVSAVGHVEHVKGISYV